MVLTAYFVLSPGTGLFCPRHQRDAKHHRQLSASVGAPGPHDFAVRLKRRSSCVAKASTASRPTFVTTRTPLVSAKSARMCERAVLAKPPVAGTEPVTPQRRQSL